MDDSVKTEQSSLVQLQLSDYLVQKSVRQRGPTRGLALRDVFPGKLI